MLPQHRTKVLKMRGGAWEDNVVYNNVVINTVALDHIDIGKNVCITTGVKIFTHYLGPTLPEVHFRIGHVYVEDDVFIGMNACICNSVTIGKGTIIL